MFKDKFIQYISSEKRFSEHTIKSYSSDISQFQHFLSLEFDITNEVEEISFQLIRSWIAFLLENGINPRSVKRKISTLKTYFKFLLREGVLQENPMLKVISPKSKKRLPVFIEEDQIENLLNKVENKLYRIGIPDNFVEHGTRDELLVELGLSSENIISILTNIYF